MTTVANLMGLGMPGPLANALGNTTQAVTCAASTTASGAGAVQPGYHVVIFTAVTGANSAVLATNMALGAPYYCINPVGAAVTAILYTPNVTGALMNGATNSSVLFTTGKSAVLIQTSANVWVSIPLSP